MCIEVIYNHKRYPTITACLKEYGLKINTFTVYRRRCLPGVDINTALEVYIGKQLRKTAYPKPSRRRIEKLLEKDTL